MILGAGVVVGRMPCTYSCWWTIGERGVGRAGDWEEGRIGDTCWQGTGWTPTPFTLNSKRCSEKLEVIRTVQFQRWLWMSFAGPSKVAVTGNWPFKPPPIASSHHGDTRCTWLMWKQASSKCFCLLHPVLSVYDSVAAKSSRRRPWGSRSRSPKGEEQRNKELGWEPWVDGCSWCGVWAEPTGWDTVHFW